MTVQTKQDDAAESAKGAPAAPLFPLTLEPGTLRLADGLTVGVRRLRSSDYARAMIASEISVEELATGGPRAMLFALTLARMAVVTRNGVAVNTETHPVLGKVAPETLIDDLADACEGAPDAIVTEATRAMGLTEEQTKKS